MRMEEKGEQGLSEKTEEEKKKEEKRNIKRGREDEKGCK